MTGLFVKVGDDDDDDDDDLLLRKYTSFGSSGKYFCMRLFTVCG